MDNFNSFIQDIKKIHGKRVHKISNSFGVHDAVNYYRKHRPRQSKFVLSDCEYYKIIREVHKHMGNILVQGGEISLPLKMGVINLKKVTVQPLLDKQGNLSYKAPINWEETLKLWYDSEEDFKNKTLVKMEPGELIKVIFNKQKSTFNNKSFYQFTVNRELKHNIKNAFTSKEMDAYMLMRNK